MRHLGGTSDQQESDSVFQVHDHPDQGATELALRLNWRISEHRAEARRQGRASMAG